MAISILRLGHRIIRDQRLSTHVFLVARALGATKGYYTGQRDRQLEASLEKAARAWGGKFSLQYLEVPNTILKKFPGTVVHLTVYGMPFQKEISSLRKAHNLLLIVGGGKVPPEVYRRADLNLSVSSQPHSEVAALGIFLYELQSRQFKEFRGGRLRVISQERGKKVIRAGR